MKRFFVLALICTLTLCGCGQSGANAITAKDDAMNQIYADAEEVIIGQNLLNLIAETTLYLNPLVVDDDFANEPEFWDDFITHYLKNSWFGFDYLIDANESAGFLTREQIEYIVYSAFGVHRSYDAMDEGDRLDILSASSGFSHGYIEPGSYTIEWIDDDHCRVAGEIKIEGSFHFNQRYLFDAVLVKNPESCFDGFSLCSLERTDPNTVAWGYYYNEWLENEAQNFLPNSLYDYWYDIFYYDDDFLPEMGIYENDTIVALLTVKDEKVVQITDFDAGEVPIECRRYYDPEDALSVNFLLQCYSTNPDE